MPETVLPPLGNHFSKIEEFASEKVRFHRLIFHHITKVTNSADICIDVDLTAIRYNIFFPSAPKETSGFFSFFLHFFFRFLPNILLGSKIT